MDDPIRSMMHNKFQQILVISLLTFREQIRQKVLWSAFIFSLLCVGLGYAVSRLSFAENGRIALDFGLTAIAIVGGLISIIAGSALISKEIESRTIYLILSKTVSRWQFVVGRLLGLLGVLCLNSFLMMLAVLFVFLIFDGKPEVVLLKSFILQILEFGILASVALIFSAFSTATFAAIITSGVWVIGHAMEDLRILSHQIEPPSVRPLFEFLTAILPDLTRFDVKASVTHDLPLTWKYTVLSSSYGLVYIVFLLLVSCAIFSKRDL